MNKKKDIIALALSVSFVMGGASIAQADEINPDNPSHISEKQSRESEQSVQNLGNDDKNITEGNNNSNTKDENLLLSELRTPEAQQAGETATSEPNYTEEEKNIKDYSGSERYKETDLQPGDTNQDFDKTDEKEEKDGFKFEFKNPSAASPNKTEYGYQITIDKKTGQRTYTKIYVTDSGRIPVNPGDKPMMDQKDKLTSESPEVNYKPDENTKISASRTQRNLNYEASEETLKHINNKDNPSTSFGMKENYTQDNPGVKFLGGNFALGYKVNPWPNENDKLELLKLNGSYNEKVFVQGQDLDTGIKVDNIDDSAKERLVGQVYNPNTGKIVPGARAYVGDNGNIFIKMPEGAVNEDGTLNEKSIFYKDPDYRAIQNLDVKFFARPRTAEEFKTIAETPDDNGETGTYTGSGAGTTDFNHKGKDVVIDKQGIDRYDHYNLIGNFKLNLDDTRYYDQSFKDKDKYDTTSRTYSPVKAGEEYKVEMYVPEDKSDKNKFPNQKTPKEMEASNASGHVSVKVDTSFLDKENKGKAPDDQWVLEYDKTKLPTEFIIKAPSSALPGDFIAIPMEYTYGNGSKDVHWFHFVVQESLFNKPEYYAKLGYQGNSLSSKPDLPNTATDTRKQQPESYELVEGATYTDDKGNTWTDIKVDPKTGVVTAVVPQNENIKGGEILFVPVKVNYTDKKGEPHSETIKAQFIARTPKQDDAVVVNESDTEIPFKSKEVFDENLPMGTIKVENPGKAGKGKVQFKQYVVNGKKGIIDDNGTFIPGDDKFFVESITVEDPKDRLVKVGARPLEKTVKTNFETEVTVDNTLEAGQVVTDQEGASGEVTVKTTRNPETGEITISSEETKKAQPKKIRVGLQTKGQVVDEDKIPFKYKVEFDPDFYKNYPDEKENFKIVTEGKEGSNKKTWTIVNSEIVGNPVVEETKPIDAVIKVGQKDYTGTITHTEKHEVPFEVEYKYSDELEAGQTKVEQKGEKGSYDIEYSQKIKNGQKDGEATSTKKNEKEAKKEIVIIGTKPVTKVVEKPFNTEYVCDENLEAGKTEEVTPGKNGKVTITTSYDKDQKKIVTSETEEAGQNRVVKIGGKTNGTEKVKEEIPFEVEVRKDPSLKKGEWKYATDDEGNELKGEKGEQEKTLTIVNSKVTETSEPTVTKKAKKAVILVGDEDFTGKIKSVDKDPIPFETEVTVDPSLKPGEIVEDQKGELGEQETELTREIKNGTAGEEVRGETKRTKEPVTRKIRVGAKSDGTHTYTNKKPFEVEVRVNPELKKGEHKVVQKGVEGEEEFTVTIENSKVTKTSEPKETKAPVKEIIEVGSDDFTGTFETKKAKAVEFETEYIVDETLEPGKTVVDKEGKLGEEEITVTHTIVNGKVTKSEESKPVQTKAPEKRIVRVGKKPSEGETKKTIEREIPYETKVIYDENLEAGFQKIENEGKAGKEEVTIIQKIKDSKPVGEATETTKTITEKEDRVVRIGIKPVVKETELGNNTEYRHNPELKAGEEKVIEEGSKGSVKYITTFNKETGKLEVKEERREPKNKVVEYGSKTDGEFTYESEKAYDIIIRENPNLEAGKTKVIQEGKPGKTETTVKIENSKEVSRDTKTITEKQDKIIEIGTKNVCEIPPVKPEDPTKPGEKDPEDPTKPGEKDPEDPNKPGEKDPEDPTKPGEKDPEDPNKPGEENPQDPSKPGEKDPKDPSKPGEKDPKDPEKPGEEDPKDPEKPGKEDPKDPSNPGEEKPNKPGTPGETPEKPNKPGQRPENSKKPADKNANESKDKQINPSRKLEKTKTVINKDNTNKNPSTGVASLSTVLSSLGISLSALGFTKKKRKNK